MEKVQRDMESRPSIYLSRLSWRITRRVGDDFPSGRRILEARASDSRISLGDRNTAYFHSSAIVKKGHSRICSLYNNKGETLTDSNSLKISVFDYFKSLYEAKDGFTHLNTSVGFSQITQDGLDSLSRSFTSQELFQALQTMQ